ncbi:MAG TPA: VWA domain-containing protein [Vicinamibacterales bacterium]|nr:VWA domain-containing protein [Vicinamibacterales bacterium]
MINIPSRLSPSRKAVGRALDGRPVAAAAILAIATFAFYERPLAGQEGFRFKSGVELINVTATITDRSGRFASGLRQEDFIIYDDDQPVEITHFSAERTPVSLGIVLDTSGSMAGEKIESARSAIFNFLQALPDPLDEFFMYRFSADPDLVHDWTDNRDAISRSLGRVRPAGGTAMYDAVAEAVPMAQGGQNRKKAVVIISDGNDTNSRLDVRDVQQLVRETEVLVYAIGIDGMSETTIFNRPTPPVARPPSPIPFPIPGGRGGRGIPFPIPTPMPRGGTGGGISRGGAIDDRVNVVALREITDDSGGRTEIVRDPRDLHPATAGIADELSKQYYIGYPSPGHRDGRWHNIRVEVRDRSLKVRARRGYVATP